MDQVRKEGQKIDQRDVTQIGQPWLQQKIVPPLMNDWNRV